jgi:hypothetical protein
MVDSEVLLHLFQGCKVLPEYYLFSTVVLLPVLTQACPQSTSLFLNFLLSANMGLSNNMISNNMMLPDNMLSDNILLALKFFSDSIK